MSPECMRELFQITAFWTHRSVNLEVKNNTTKFWNKSLKYRPGFSTWKSIPYQIKKETDYTKFQKFYNDWFGMKCKLKLMCKIVYLKLPVRPVFIYKQLLIFC